MCRGRLGPFGHMDKMGNDNLVKDRVHMNVEDSVKR